MLENKKIKIYSGINAEEKVAIFGSLKDNGATSYSADPDLIQNNNYENGLDNCLVAGNAQTKADNTSPLYVMSRELAYLQQAGVKGWLNNVEYFKGSIVSGDDEDGEKKLYYSLQDNNINNNILDEDWWTPLTSAGGAGGAGYYGMMFDLVKKDHVLTFEESFGLARLGEYVYKEEVAGSRYGYKDFYNTCLEEFENSTNITGTSLYKHSNGHTFYNIADKAEVDEIYERDGVAWYYGIDTENQRIFLPRNDYLAVEGRVVGDGYCMAIDNGYSIGALATEAYANGITDGGTLASSSALVDKPVGTGFKWDYSMSHHTGAGLTKDPTKSHVRNNPFGYIYMIVATNAEEKPIGEYVETTTTENDTIPLFTAKYFEFEVNNSSWLKGGTKQNSGEIYTTCYNTLVNLLTDNNINLKVIDVVDMVDGEDYSEYWKVNQDAMTFETPTAIAIKYLSDTIQELEAQGIYLYFKVANAVENLQLLDAGEVLNTLTNKLDLSENMIPSAKYVDLALGASGATYRAPANGWFSYKGMNGGNNCVVEMNCRSITFGMASSNVNNFISVCCPCKKGNTMLMLYSGIKRSDYFRFIYSTNN